MPIISCPICQNILDVPDQYAGQTGKCNHCGGSIAVPPLQHTVSPEYRRASVKSRKKHLAVYALCAVLVAFIGFILYSALQMRRQNGLYPDETKTIMLPGNVSLELVWIPAGSFMMGSPDNEAERSRHEGPQRRVTFSQGFWMGKYEVTQAQWQAVMGSNPICFDGEYSHPVSMITWNDSQDFLDKLSQYGAGMFRLPSEAEWEYACRAGSTTVYYFGDDASQLGEYAWYERNTDWGAYHPVGQKKPNAWGVYDMAGNVFEWCEDDWHDDYSGAPVDGSAWVDTPRGPHRVQRGGNSGNSSWFCRSASRGRDSLEHWSGFRVVLAAD